MNGLSIIQRMRDHHGRRCKEVTDEAKVGVWATVGKDAEVEKGDHTLRLWATTADADLDGEIVNPDGAVTEYFFKNRSIFADHQYDARNMIGQLRSASLQPGRGWMIRIRMVPELKGNPLPADIITMAKAGAPPGTSIGFIAKDYGRPTDEEKAAYGGGFGSIVRKWLWLESSLTFMPCNVACQTLDARRLVDDHKMGIVDGLLCKGAICRESAAALGFPTRRKVIIRCVA